MSWTLRYALTAFMLSFAITAAAPSADAQWFAGDLRSAANRADYVIVTRAQFASTVAPLAAFRASRNGFTVMTVLMDSIASQFHRDTPDSSLRDLLVYITDRWQQPRPRFCLLAGAAGHVPSHKLPSAILFSDGGREDSILVDQWLVTAPGSAFPLPPPVLSIGRMPAWSVAELQAMVDKTIAYETAESGVWARRAIVLSDSADMGSFEDEARVYLRAFAPVWSDTIDIDVRPASPFHRTPASFIESWGQGCAFIAFIGHANWERFSSWYFTTENIGSLPARDELPVCILLGAQKMGSPDTVTMAVALLKAAHRGAVCAIAPTGLMYLFEAGRFNQSVIDYLVAHRNEPIGSAWKAALGGGRSETDARWTLFGDPALSVKSHDLIAGTGATPSAPAGFALLQNYPNPFNPSTMIRYAVPTTSFVTLRVFNTLGQEIAILQDGVQDAGFHEVRFDGARFAAGVYLCRMQSGSFMETTKLLLIR